ncbi:MAG: type IV pilin protein [bacterium]
MKADSMGMKKHAGFTLIELMIVIAIIAIIVAIAYPSYQEQIRKTRRSEGQAALLKVDAEETRYFTNYGSYVTDLTSAPPTGLGLDSATTENGYYIVTAAVAGSTYTLTATPQSAQASDTICGNLTLTNAGVKSATGSSPTPAKTCW